MSDWHLKNQLFLTHEMTQLRALLEGSPLQTDPLDSSEAPDSEFVPSLLMLSRSLGMTSFERNVLLLCAAVELEGEFANLCATVQGIPGRTYPTFSLAFSLLPEAHWSALTPDAPLRRWRLIELESGRFPLTLSPLRIDERVLHYLTGISYLAPEIALLTSPVLPPTVLAPSHMKLAAHIASAWETAVSASEHDVTPLLQFLCSDTTLRCELAAATAENLGLHLYRLAPGNLPLSDWEPLLRLWEREAALGNCARYVDWEELDVLDAGRRQILQRWLDRCQGLVILGVEHPWAITRTFQLFEVSRSARAEQRQVWEKALGPGAESLNGHLDRVTTQFNLGVSTIQNAARTLASSNDEPTVERLWNSCLLQTRPALEQLAQRLPSSARWEDLVLPDTHMSTLKTMVAQVRQRSVVLEDWGFAARGSRGLGLGALFAGSSGTGKTTAAEVIAAELHLDLFRIDLSSVVSKYIGETEKNLRRIFDAAEAGGAILLFDEADALFGKRSEVKDSHDRHANIEVSYLLQRMESFRGLAILTTNMKQSLDVAFLRRLRFVVNFPFPDVSARAELWRRAFPANTPCHNLDYEKLARLNVAGGNIANIALNAAYIAAEFDNAITMQHLLLAARMEYAKLEKTLTAAETSDWLATSTEAPYDTRSARNQPQQKR
jgi:hypothetical protein